MITFEEYLKDHLKVSFDSRRFKELFDDMMFDLEEVGKKRSIERHKLYKWIGSKLNTVEHVMTYSDDEGNYCEVRWLPVSKDDDELFLFMSEPIVYCRLWDGFNPKIVGNDIQETLHSMYEEFINIRTQ